MDIKCKYLVGDTGCMKAGVDCWSYYLPCTLALLNSTPCPYEEKPMSPAISLAIHQLESEINRLEEGKRSVDELIAEKRRQIMNFLALIEELNEKGNAEGKPFKTS